MVCLPNMSSGLIPQSACTVSLLPATAQLLGYPLGSTSVTLAHPQSHRPHNLSSTCKPFSHDLQEIFEEEDVVTLLCFSESSEKSLAKTLVFHFPTMNPPLPSLNPFPTISNWHMTQLWISYRPAWSPVCDADGSADRAFLLLDWSDPSTNSLALPKCLSVAFCVPC